MIETEKDFFNERAGTWDEEETVPPEKYRRIMEETGIEDGHSVLDAGTGTGVLIPYILEVARSNTMIFAIDYAERMIERLTEKGFPANVKPSVMDIHRTVFEENFFDRIIVNSCYPHFKDKKTALREIHRIIKPEGICVICHPTGNKHVNHLHKNSHSVIANHILGNMQELKRSAQSAGFRFLKGIDEEDFFLISFTK